MGVDLTQEAVDRLGLTLLRLDALYKMPSCADAASTLRALSARVVELEAERDEAIGANILNRNAVRMQQVKRHASERALATARADALREAAAVAKDHTPEKHTGMTLASHVTGRTIEKAILALIPQEKPHE
jgi:hypothetical protein